MIFIIAGNVDCGNTLLTRGKTIEEPFPKCSLHLEDPDLGIEDIVYSFNDPKSGGLYSIYLSALAKRVKDSDDKQLTVDTFRSAS